MVVSQQPTKALMASYVAIESANFIVRLDDLVLQSLVISLVMVMMFYKLADGIA